MAAPDIGQDEDVTRADGIETVVNVFGHMFPHLQDH
jgi:hypothetical protein